MLEMVSMATVVVHGLVEPKRLKEVFGMLFRWDFDFVYDSCWSKGKPGKIPVLNVQDKWQHFLNPESDG